jgi:hypothetical protein
MAALAHSSMLLSRRRGSLAPAEGPSMMARVLTEESCGITRSQECESTNRLCQSTAGGPEPTTRTARRPARVWTNWGGVLLEPSTTEHPHDIGRRAADAQPSEAADPFPVKRHAPGDSGSLQAVTETSIRPLRRREWR